MFRKILEKVSAVLSGLTVGMTIFSMAAFALTVPPTYAPRNFQTQQVGYFRIFVQQTTLGAVVNGQPGCVIGIPSATNCVVKVGALPPNAYIIRISMQILVSFNSATTDLLGLGVSTAAFPTAPFLPATAVNLLALASVHGAAGGAVAQTVVAANAGTTLTNNAQNQFGTDGGQDLYLQYQQTGAGGTAGQAILVLEYIAPNDGACTDVPLGGTAANGLFPNC
jgi:hypothetical protein